MGNLRRRIRLGLVVLWLMLAAWLWYGWHHPPELPASAQSTEPPGLTSADLSIMPGSAGPMAPLAEYGELIERPLFYPNRRPPATPSIEMPEVIDNGDDLMLIGVMLAGDAIRALVRDERSGRVNRIMPGDMIAGWRLEQVGAEHVVLMQGEEVRVLNLVRNRPRPETTRPSAGDSVEAEPAPDSEDPLDQEQNVDEEPEDAQES